MNEIMENELREPLTPAAMKYMIARVIDNANDAIKESIVKKDDENENFYRGRKFAYYEVLDTLKNELIAHDQDLKEFGLDENLEKKLWL